MGVVVQCGCGKKKKKKEDARASQLPKSTKHYGTYSTLLQIRFSEINIFVVTGYNYINYNFR